MAETNTAGSGGNSNLFAALAYFLGILGIIFYFIAPKEDKHARFAALQSAALSVTVVIFFTGIGVVAMILGVVTMGIGAIIALPLMGFLSLVYFLLWIYLMYTAFTGKKVSLPVIGSLVEKYA